MATKVLLVAVFVLAAAAAGDALRGEGAGEGRDPGTADGASTAGERRGAGYAFPLPGQGPEAQRGFVLPRQGRFRGDGRFLRKRVVREGREYLSAQAVEDAFPGADEGPLDISKVAIAPDGTLVLAVYRFPAGERAAGALLFWRDRRLVGAFGVPPGHFGGGLAFNRRGDLVALFSHDGALRGVYDRRGRRLEGLPDRFLDAG